MTRPSQSDRGRLVEALGLGPLWVRRMKSAGVDTIGADDDISADAATLDWDTLQRMVVSGRACGLTVGRGAGAPDDGIQRRDWLVIGAPAIDDDANDGAFASPAGRLLDAMLAAVGLDRDRTVLVTALAKCRPHATGKAICRSCLERQIELLAPRLILVVGDVATAALFPEASNFDRFRGMEHRLTIAGRDIPVVATFHPLKLLEDRAAKAPTWADLCLARTIHERISAAAIA